MSWLEDHLTSFVDPVLGEDLYSKTPLNYFTQEELTTIKNAWRSVKRAADGKPIFLPGRDVFIFEVLAQREKYPTLFMPECSRLTVKHLSRKIENLSDYHLFDTGFAGSIPRGLGVTEFTMLSHDSYLNRSETKQVFPRMSFSRGLALKIEGTPKYWQTGQIYTPELTTWREEIRQDLSPIFEFGRAARLTIEVYTNSSPKFINEHNPLKTSMKGGWY